MMRNIIKKILIISLIFSAFSVPVFAQRSGSIGGSGSSSTPPQPSLTVDCNVPGASVEIKVPEKYATPITGTAPFTAVLEAGSYSVTVSAPGYQSQSKPINFRSTTSMYFNLDSDSQNLSVKSNVQNAAVEIRSTQNSRTVLNGTAPFTAALDKGQYTVTVSASGYVSQTQNVNLQNSKTVNFNLEVENYSLSVTSNVVNARVQIKGAAINGTLNGNTTYNTVLPPGSYNVKVNAPGYFALTKTVQLNGTQSVDFQLQPKTAKLNVVIPNEILNYTVSNPAGQVMIYDNGKLVSGTNIQLNPGQHTIRIVSGAFAAQQTINVRAGETYSFELNFGFSVNKN